MTAQSCYRVLIVDDSPADRTLYCRYLSQDNRYTYEVLEATSVREGLRLCEQTRPDLVLLDYRLPDEEGLVFIREWTARYGGCITPIIMLTGQGNERVAVDAMKHGTQDYLIKSDLTQEYFCLSIHSVLERVHLQDQLEKKRKQQQLLETITLRIRESLNCNVILQTAVQEVLQFLDADRVLIFRLWGDGTATAITEAVQPDYSSLANQSFSEEVFPKKYHSFYCKGNIRAISDIHEMSPCLMNLVESFGVQAELVVPILHRGSHKDREMDLLWGLLIVHQCRSTRQWEAWEIESLRHLVTHLVIAIQQSEMHERVVLSNTELYRATRLKDEFLAKVSHELRTPLNTILGMSESLKEGFLGSLTIQQKLSVTAIERSGQHLLEIVNDILDLAQLESGQLELRFAPVNVNDLCTDSLNCIRQQAIAKTIQLTAEIPFGLPPIKVDELRIRQALINLLSNAIKFTPKGGSVKLKAQQETLHNEQVLCLQVSDTGIGIAPEDISKLFDPFIQLDNSYSRRYGGTGLGLSLVRRLVELHQGMVSVTSEVGQGSCFSIYLPYRTTEFSTTI